MQILCLSLIHSSRLSGLWLRPKLFEAFSLPAVLPLLAWLYHATGGNMKVPLKHNTTQSLNVYQGDRLETNGYVVYVDLGSIDLSCRQTYRSGSAYIDGVTWLRVVRAGHAQFVLLFKGFRYHCFYWKERWQRIRVNMLVLPSTWCDMYEHKLDDLLSPWKGVSRWFTINPIVLPSRLDKDNICELIAFCIHCVPL